MKNCKTSLFLLFSLVLVLPSLSIAGPEYEKIIKDFPDEIQNSRALGNAEFEMERNCTQFLTKSNVVLQPDTKSNGNSNCLGGRELLKNEEVDELTSNSLFVTKYLQNHSDNVSVSHPVKKVADTKYLRWSKLWDSKQEDFKKYNPNESTDESENLLESLNSTSTELIDFVIKKTTKALNKHKAILSYYEMHSGYVLKTVNEHLYKVSKNNPYCEPQIRLKAIKNSAIRSKGLEPFFTSTDRMVVEAFKNPWFVRVLMGSAVGGVGYSLDEILRGNVLKPFDPEHMLSKLCTFWRGWENNEGKARRGHRSSHFIKAKKNQIQDIETTLANLKNKKMELKSNRLAKDLGTIDELMAPFIIENPAVIKSFLAQKFADKARGVPGALGMHSGNLCFLLNIANNHKTEDEDFKTNVSLVMSGVGLVGSILAPEIGVVLFAGQGVYEVGTELNEIAKIKANKLDDTSSNAISNDLKIKILSGELFVKENKVNIGMLTAAAGFVFSAVDIPASKIKSAFKISDKGFNSKQLKNLIKKEHGSYFTNVDNIVNGLPQDAAPDLRDLLGICFTPNISKATSLKYIHEELCGEKNLSKLKKFISSCKVPKTAFNCLKSRYFKVDDYDADLEKYVENPNIRALFLNTKRGLKIDEVKKLNDEYNRLIKVGVSESKAKTLLRKKINSCRLR